MILMTSNYRASLAGLKTSTWLLRQDQDTDRSIGKLRMFPAKRVHREGIYWAKAIVKGELAQVKRQVNLSFTAGFLATRLLIRDFGAVIA